MSKPPKTPIQPLTMLKGAGLVRSKAGDKARSLSTGDKALLALDATMTESMRRDGLLPSLPEEHASPPERAGAPLPEIADYDAMQLPVWTLVMALAWIATRSAESVTWQRDDWRREHGWPEASVPTSLDPDPEDEPHPAFYSSAAAMIELKAKGEAGELEVRAMSVSRNQPVVLTPLDWSYGALQFNRRFDEVWVVGGDEYVRLTVQRDNLIKVFPPREETPTATLPELVTLPDQDAGDEETGTVRPKFKAFYAAFEAMIRANPNEKQMNRKAGAAWARANFNLGPTQYRSAREFVFSKLRDEGVEHVYDQSGAPRKERG